MPALDVDSRELRRLMDDAKRLTPEQRQRAWRALRETTMETVRGVKVLMPVDTGRARASWGLWSADQITGSPDTKPAALAKARAEASDADAVLRMDESQLVTVQGSNLPYIQGLNEGHSRKAPAGFLDLAEEAAEQMLQQRLAEAGVLF